VKPQKPHSGYTLMGLSLAVVFPLNTGAAQDVKGAPETHKVLLEKRPSTRAQYSHETGR